MSEWIRHRGSKSMPKRLEGMRFEVRHRIGSTASGNAKVYRWEWKHLGFDWDILAYRILGDIEQPKTAIELQAEEVGIPEPVQEWPEDRVDIVGQNGNDGLHYDAVTTNKYQRIIKGVTVDVYDVLAAFGVNCQARGHAIKKLLMAGQRGHKDGAQDLREAMQAIERSIQLTEGGK